MHTYILYICNNTYVYHANICIYIYTIYLACVYCVYHVYMYVYICVRVYVQRKARFLFYCTLLFFWSLEFIQLAVRSAQYWQDQPA